MIINTPLTKDVVKSLHAGDRVLISGTIYAARDAAHKRLVEMIKKGEKLPFDLNESIIYYVGPCPEKPGDIIGSCGPTTSTRMDAYAPKLISLGLSGMIGKGQRSKEVVDAMILHKAVYFGATGGLGALLAQTVVKNEVIAFPELGAEAVRKLLVKDFPAVVVIDCEGNNLYEIGRNRANILA